MAFSEKVLYHFEAFGGPVESMVNAAFTSVLEPHGWCLIVIDAEVQYDGSSCGVWLQVARDAFLAYVQSENYGSKTFASFLAAWLLSHGVVNLRTLQGAPVRRAGSANTKFILEQRAEMRGRLVQLAMESKLQYAQAMLEGFALPVAGATVVDAYVLSDDD